MPPRTPSAEPLLRVVGKPEYFSPPSLPNARRAGPDVPPCFDGGDGWTANGAPVLKTLELHGKRVAVDSTRGLRISVEKSREYRKKRRGRAVSTAGLPGLTGMLDSKEW